MSRYPLCRILIPDEEMFDHVSDHGHHEVVDWGVDQAS